MLGPRRNTIEVARTILARQIPPSLKRAPQPGLDQHKLGLEHQVAPADPALIHEGTDIYEPLPAENLSSDHPIKRAAIAQLIRPLGYHASAVHVLARQAPLEPVLETFFNPKLQLLD